MSATTTAGTAACTQAAGTVTCDAGTAPDFTLIPGASATVALTVNLDSALAAGSAVANTAAANSAESDLAEATASTPIERSADLGLTKTALSDPVPAGGAALWQLDVTNNGPSDATNLSITDTLPAGVTFDPDSSSGTCSESAGVVTCTVASLTNGTTANVLIGVTLDPDINPGTVISNTATVNATEADPVAGNDDGTATFTVSRLADLSIVKNDIADPVVAGDSIAWSLTVANAGPSDTTSVIIEDAIPAGITFTVGVGASGVSCAEAPVGLVTCTIASLAADDTTTITMTGTVDPLLPDGTVITNTATITGQTGTDPVPGNNTDDETTDVNRVPGLIFSKTASATSVVAGEQLTWTLDLANTGLSVASGVTIVDSLPASVTFVSADVTNGTATCGEALGIVSCDVGASPDFELLSGTSVAVDITVLVDSALPAGSSVFNEATADSNESAATNADIDVPVTRSADLRLGKTASPEPVTAGEIITWTLTATNDGPSAASNVTVTDTIPAGVTITALPDPATGVTCVNAAPLLTCTIGSLANGASGGFSFSATVDPSLATLHELANSAAVSADEPDPTDNNGATESTFVIRESDLALSKTAPPGPIVAGETATWTLSVSNAGPSDTANVVMEDSLPAGVTFVSSSAGCTDAPSGLPAATVTCSVALLPVGATVSIAVTGLIDEAAVDAADLVNNAAITAQDGTDPAPGNNTTDATVAVTRVPELLLSKTPTAMSVVAGESLGWQLVLTNIGSSTASGVNISDTLPGGVSFISAVVASGTGTCTENLGTVTCSVGTAPNFELAPGSSITVDLEASASSALAAGASVDNTATADSNESLQVTADAVTPVTRSADLSVLKSSTPATAIAGDEVTWTITVMNAGPSDATDISISDLLPSGITITDLPEAALTGVGCLSDGARLTCAIAGLADDESISFSYTATLDASLASGDALMNVATASGAEPDPDPGNNTGSNAVGVTRSADIQLTKTAGTATAGDVLVWTLTATNAGPSDATNVIIQDVLPGTVTFDPAATTPGCTEIAGAVTCPIGDLVAGGSQSVTIAALVDASLPSGSTILNAASAGADESDPDTINNEASVPAVVATSADLQVSKSASDSIAVAGQPFGWTIDVFNAGPSDALAVTVSDTLPAGVTFATATPGCTGGATVTCSLATIAAGTTTTVDIVVTVDSGTTGTLTNAASASSSTPDPDGDNTSPVVETPVQLLSDIEVVKTSSPNPVVPGADVTYTVVVTNNGPSDISGVELSDPLPAALGDPLWSCEAGDPGATCVDTSTHPNLAFDLALAAGSSATLTIVAPVDPGSTGSIANTASVTLPVDWMDPIPQNNIDTNLNPSVAVADLSATKSAPIGTVASGEEVMWMLSVRNDGPSSVSGATIVDQLPFGVVNPTWTCTPASASGSCSAASGTGDVLVDVEMVPGDVINVTVTGTIALPLGGNLDNTMEVILPPGVEDPNLTNNTAVASLGVNADPTATPTATSTATPTPIPPTATPTAIPPTATPTAIPPTATPTAIPTNHNTDSHTSSRDRYPDSDPAAHHRRPHAGEDSLHPGASGWR